MKRIKIIEATANRLGMILLILATSFPLSGLSAQFVRINLIVNSKPTAYLADWYKPQNGTVVLMAQKGGAIRETSLRFETELLNGDDQVVYKLQYQNSDVVTVSGDMATFPLSAILQLNNGVFTGSRLTNDFSSGGKLAAGQYSIRLRVWDGMKETAFSEWTPSKRFLISSYQLPQLMLPADGAILDKGKASSVIMFRWTPLTPSLPQAVTSYRIQIWQVLPGHTPMQTLRSVPPIEDKIVRGTTQFIWQPRVSLNDVEQLSTNKFIWTVQSLDEKGMPIESADLATQGISQPSVFTVATTNK